MKKFDKVVDSEVISTNLKRVRGAKGISQSVLAKKVGLSVSAYSKIENGKAKPEVSDLLHIAEALGVSLEMLVSPVPAIQGVRFN